MHDDIPASEWMAFEDNAHMVPAEETKNYLEVAGDFLTRADGPTTSPGMPSLHGENSRGLPSLFKRRYRGSMDRSPVSLVEFPADDPERALRFWQGVLNIELVRKGGEGEGWQTRFDAAEIGVHKRGAGPATESLQIA